MQSPPEPAQFRLLNRDGTFNIARRGVRRRFGRDLYHHLLSVSWAQFLLLLVVVYVLTNLVFAGGYVLCGPDALEGARHDSTLHYFADAYFFSVQTFATIGYGKIAPTGFLANVLVSAEALAGLLLFAMATGLLKGRVTETSILYRSSGSSHRSLL
jgi:inward rectifier potassium channel